MDSTQIQQAYSAYISKHNERPKNIKQMRVLLSLFFFTCYTVYSQGEANNWFFSYQCGIDFNSGVPVANNVTPMGTASACAVASDANGNLLFYTNGTTVYQSDHNPMVNGTGLLGSLASAPGPFVPPVTPGASCQGAGIVQNPGNPNEYYVFTLGAIGYDGLRYSIVDLTLSGGLGDVTATKNILLEDTLAEKMTIVKHANCTNYWVMVHKNFSSDFYAYEVTPSGINAPVISTIGQPLLFVPSSPPPGTTNFTGQMKFSPDGSLLVNTVPYSGYVELFDFDNNTGILSNVRSSPPSFWLTNVNPNTGTVFSRMFGAEFSPNGKYLYISQVPGISAQVAGNYSLIWQFPTDVPNFWLSGQTIQGTLPAQPTLSVYLLGQLYGMQLGPDGKIYISRFGTSTLSVIDKPNLPGVACDYLHAGMSFGSVIGLPNQIPGGVNTTQTIASLSLPVFSQDLFNQPADFSIVNGPNFCEGNSIAFEYNGALNPDSIIWNFDDPTSGTSNTSSILNPTHSYLSSGNYAPQLIVWKNCVSDTISYGVTIDSSPSFSLGADTLLCDGTSIDFDFSSYTDVDFLWSDGSTNSSISVSASATIGLQMIAQSSGCSATDSIVVDFVPILDASISISNDTLCINGSPELLSFANSGGTLSGQGINLAGEFDPSIGVGVYTINHAFGGLCPSQDSIIISVFDLPEINFTTDTLIGCSPLTVTFVNNNTQNGQTFLWSFGDGGQSNQGGVVQYDYTNSGTYDVSLEITSPEGCSNANTLNALIDVLPSPEAYFQYTQILSDSGSVIEFTDLSNGANGWIWDFGNGEVSNLSEPIVLFEPGYNASIGLTVTSINGCNDTYTSLIQTLDQFLLYVPNSFTPNGDGKNDVFTPKVRGADPRDYIFRIYNRWGEQVFETNQIGEGWDGSFNEAASDVQSGMYVWIIIMKRNENASKIQRSGHVNLLR